MLKNILIADDNQTDRRMLCNVLNDDYNVLCAVSEKEIFQIINDKQTVLSAVILRNKMSASDECDILTAIKKSGCISLIPIIIISSENEINTDIKALSCGASDIIFKPYCTEIIKKRLENLIRISETVIDIDLANTDILTGLYSRAAFFKKAAEMIALHEPGYYVMGCFDIDKFKVINDQYGNDKGDDVLKFIAQVFKESFGKMNGICSRITADKFAVIYPKSFIDSDELIQLQKTAAAYDGSTFPLTFSIGRYIIDDLSLSPSAMYDRAMMAEASIKGRFDEHIAFYDESMRMHLLREKEISSEMKSALESGQFVVWFQPQYNHSSGALIGAEALVRWKHPKKGLISPNDFIPVFEKNGFIYELDKFVWRKTCSILKKWIDEGYSVLPVSVNVSRYDIFCTDLIDTIINLIKEYDIPVNLFHLEITESAFVKSVNEIIHVVKSLVDYGFIVEIDDFGSGYSSLNTLKDVPVQVLKLDMCFLKNTNNSDRGGNIIESIVRMTKWLGMSVIAEGVEKIEQADYLRSIGCNYIQGYLYSKPIPADEYDLLLQKAQTEKERMKLETVETLDNNAFWNPQSIDTLIFNSYVGNACIFEYHNESVELLRITNKFMQMLSKTKMTSDEVLKLKWEKYFNAESLKKIKKDILKSYKTKSEITNEYILNNLPNCSKKVFFRSIIRVIAVTDQRYLVYCLCEDMTAQRIAEQKEKQMLSKIKDLNDNLISLMNDVPGGYARLKVFPEQSASEIEYINEGLCSLVGRTSQEIMSIYGSDITLGVHPEDVKIVQDSIKEAFKSNGRTSVKYRIRNKNGEYIWLQMFGRLTQNDEGNYYLNAYYTDLSEKEKREIIFLETMPFLLKAIMKSSTDLAFAKDKDFKYICCTDAFAKFAGKENESDVIGKNDFDLFDKQTAEQFRHDDENLFSSKMSIINKIEPIPVDDEISHYSRTSKYLLQDTFGNVIGLYGIGHDITEYRNSYSHLKLLTDSIPGGIATYVCSADKIRIVYFNDGFCNLIGCSREEYLEIMKTGLMLGIFEEDRHLLFEKIEYMRKTGNPIKCTYRIHNVKDNGFKWVDLRGVLLERHGEEYIVNTVQYDVTESKFSEDKMRKAQEKLLLSNQLVDDSSSAVYVCDAETYEMLYINRKCAHMCGKTIYEAQGAKCYSYLKGLDKPCVPCYMDNSTYDQYIKREYTSHVTGRHYMTRGKLINWGGRRALVEYLSDETDSINTKLSLQAGHRAMEMATQNSVISFWQYDIDRRTITWGAYKSSDYKGYPDIMTDIPDSLFDAGDVHFSDISECRRMYNELFSNAERSECTIRIFDRGNQKYIWHHIVYTRLHDLSYSTRQAIGFSANVDLQQEMKLRYEHEKRLCLEIIKDSIIYYEINLSSNVITEYRSEFDDIASMRSGITYTEELADFILKNISDYDRESVRHTIFPKALLKAYRRGKTSVELIYRRYITNYGLRWIKAKANIMKKPLSEEIVAFLYFYDVDEEETDKYVLNSVMDEEIDSVAVINIKNGLARFIKNHDNLGAMKTHISFEYNDFVRKMISECVDKDEQSACLDFYLLENLKKMLEKAPCKFFTYKVRENNLISRKRTIAYYLDCTRNNIVLSRRDITELYKEEQRQKETLRMAVNAANEANRAKSEFLSRMSHDMRTPMNAIIGLVNLAKEESDLLRINDYLDNIDTSSHFLLGLINDILDLSKIESGKIELNEEVFDYSDFIRGIDTVIRPLMNAKKIDFFFKIDCGVKRIVVDKMRFSQIFFNLLSNAAKYTLKGGYVEFVAEHIPDKNGKYGMRFYIRDSGIGMSAEFLEKIFDPFSQEKNDYFSEMQGSGLGLAIVKNLIAAMDGKITVRSELGEGTEFVVDLYVHTDKMIKEKNNDPVDYSLLNGLSILIVEDNAMNVLVAQKLLEQKGCVISVARNGLEAVEMFSKSQSGFYSAILMDIRMPVMDGLVATKKIRMLSRDDATKIPIIAMTADSYVEEKNKTFEVGMNAYVGKPVEPDVLYGTIINQIKLL